MTLPRGSLLRSFVLSIIRVNYNMAKNTTTKAKALKVVNSEESRSESEDSGSYDDESTSEDDDDDEEEDENEGSDIEDSVAHLDFLS